MTQRFYDHPDIAIARSQSLHLPATAATTVVTKFVAFAKMKIKSVRGGVLVAGTNTAAGYALLNGTTTVGAITAGTSTAGSALTGTITAANATLAEGDQLDIKTLADSATLVSAITIEFQLEPDADVL